MKTQEAGASLQEYFKPFREHIIGVNTLIQTPFSEALPLCYADWTASGRMYQPIEDKLLRHFYPMVANTHTDTNHTGSSMTYAYHLARKIIKTHVNAAPTDVLITSNSGMTGVVNKFQRILGFKLHESFKDCIHIKLEDRPVVFISHMEHHSNQTSWLETICEVVVIPPDREGLFSLEHFSELLHKYSSRKVKIAAVSSCSNVTGIMTPYHDIAALIHSMGGWCFVDFACSAPYVDINMHENDEKGRYLDAIYFSPHKFLGGPGSSGVLIFNQVLYKNAVPDDPGGGTVDWTNPWGQHKYVDNIESREDGGTPGFLQTIRTALAIRLKEQMGVKNILKREEEMLQFIFEELETLPNLHILAGVHKHRLGVVSFYIDGLHYNVGVKMLNDFFGIQVRGGCSCAGTYGHFLLNVAPETSHEITNKINQGDCSLKPGWIRLSIHPTLTDDEVKYILSSIKQLTKEFRNWEKYYFTDFSKGIIKHQNEASEQAMRREMETGFSL